MSPILVPGSIYYHNGKKGVVTEVYGKPLGKVTFVNLIPIKTGCLFDGVLEKHILESSIQEYEFYSSGGEWKLSSFVESEEVFKISKEVAHQLRLERQERWEAEKAAVEENYNALRNKYLYLRDIGPEGTEAKAAVNLLKLLRKHGIKASIRKTHNGYNVATPYPDFSFEDVQARNLVSLFSAGKFNFEELRYEYAPTTLWMQVFGKIMYLTLNGRDV